MVEVVVEVVAEVVVDVVVEVVVETVVEVVAEVVVEIVMYFLLLADCDTRQRSARRNPVAIVTRFNTCPCRSAYFCVAIRSGSRRGA